MPATIEGKIIYEGVTTSIRATDADPDALNLFDIGRTGKKKAYVVVGHDPDGRDGWTTIYFEPAAWYFVSGRVGVPYEHSSASTPVQGIVGPDDGEKFSFKGTLRVDGLEIWSHR